MNEVERRGRRDWIAGAAALGAGAALAAHAPGARAERVKTNARIVIAGSGLGGLAVANRLSASLDGARITIVDAKTEHNYQPGYTLVATGIWPMAKVRSENASFVPPGVEWVQEAVAAFDPQANQVETVGGRKIGYDYLVVATGVHLDYAQIDGMDVSAIGSNGLGSVYAGPREAAATWASMDAFRAKGGDAVMTLPATPLKCAGAPLKMTFMLADRLRQAGTRERSTIRFHTALPTDTVFGVKAVNDNVLARWKALGIATEYLSRLVAVDPGARRAVFASPEGERTEIGYDFLHVVPPMRAVDAVKNSELAWKEGPFAAGGWLEVDKDTLRHRRFPNVFGIGDINGTPRGKTAATVKKSAPIVAGHLVDVVAGREPGQRFDGYTSCPLLVREGSAMLIEFDYDGRLTPTLPLVDPLQESWFAWVMKTRMLEPAYRAVLHGRV
ncbi:MAG: NAD(P)/FAD-dependent oxidoreductase [Burkholderiaceae bacterium]|nr:NAD(P)/FAD-dependent oxidoreductase [Burkholderiaceae bacterium]